MTRLHAYRFLCILEGNPRPPMPRALRRIAINEHKVPSNWGLSGPVELIGWSVTSDPANRAVIRPRRRYTCTSKVRTESDWEWLPGSVVFRLEFHLLAVRT